MWSVAQTCAPGDEPSLDVYGDTINLSLGKHSDHKERWPPQLLRGGVSCVISGRLWMATHSDIPLAEAYVFLREFPEHRVIPVSGGMAKMTIVYAPRSPNIPDLVSYEQRWWEAGSSVHLGTIIDSYHA